MTCVFITGATGVVGSELVPLFLESPETEVRILVRAEDENRLRHRVDDLFDYWQLSPDLEADFRRRLVALPGDRHAAAVGARRRRLAAPRSGDNTHRPRGGQCPAESIDRGRPARMPSIPPAALPSWHGPRASGGPAKLDAVSTVGVAGRMQGLIPSGRCRARVPQYLRAGQGRSRGFPSRRTGQAPPLTIHRPSMVVGRSDTGRIIRFQVFYYLCDFLSGAKTWGFVPDTGEATLDIIPVD